MWVLVVLETILTLHFAIPVVHHRIPFQSSNDNVFVAHRSNAMFVHIAFQMCIAHCHVVHRLKHPLAAAPVIYRFQQCSGVKQLSVSPTAALVTLTPEV